MKLKLLVTVVSIMILAFPIFAKDTVCTKRLNFGNINHKDTVVGIVKGFDTKSYKFNAKKNQTLRVKLVSDIVHFNVYAPHKGPIEGALFDGSSEGTYFSSKLKKSGTYTIQVYLTDEEAEKDEKIIYTLEIGLE